MQELLKLHAVTEMVVPIDTDANVATNLQSLQADGLVTCAFFGDVSNLLC